MSTFPLTEIDIEQFASYSVLLNADSAKQLLALNTKSNRSISRSRVLRYAKNMKSGQWKLNGQNIIISKSGEMIDGQHRCLAIIESGVEVLVGITFGVESDDETFETLDGGRARDASTFLTGKYRNQRTAFARAMLCVEKSGFVIKRNTFNDRSFSNPEILEWMKRHPFADDYVQQYAHLADKTSRSWKTGSPVGLLLGGYFSDLEIKNYWDHVDGCYQGTGAPIDSPVRAWFTKSDYGKNPDTGEKFNISGSTTIFSYLIGSFIGSAMREAKPMSVLRNTQFLPLEGFKVQRPHFDITEEAQNG